MNTLNTWGPMTVLVILLALVVVGVGGYAVIADDLDFQAFLDALSKAAVGAGALGIGRGIMIAGRSNSDA